MDLKIIINSELDIPDHVFADAAAEFVTYIKKYALNEMSKGDHYKPTLLPEKQHKKLSFGFLNHDILSQNKYHQSYRSGLNELCDRLLAGNHLMKQKKKKQR